MAVLGAVLGLVGLRGPLRSERLDLEAAARELAGSLRLARARAIAQNRPVAVAIGTAAYSLDGGPPRPLPARAAAAPPPGGAVVFAPDGSAFGEGVTLRSGGRQVAVSVSWLTGRVSVAAGP